MDWWNYFFQSSTKKNFDILKNWSKLSVKENKSLNN